MPEYLNELCNKHVCSIMKMIQLCLLFVLFLDGCNLCNYV